MFLQQNSLMQLFQLVKFFKTNMKVLIWTKSYMIKTMKQSILMIVCHSIKIYATVLSVPEQK